MSAEALNFRCIRTEIIKGRKIAHVEAWVEFVSVIALPTLSISWLNAL
jgi:hypothetical protein